MTVPRASRAWLAVALLLASCDRPAQTTAATDGNAAQLASPAPAPAAPSQPQFPARTGRVVDNAELLTPDEEAELTRRLAMLEARTTDQLVVVTVPSLDGRTDDEYSDSLGNHWGIGQEDKDNGVILLVAPTERRTRIAIGYGLEAIISNQQAQQIIDRDLLPAFRDGRWKDGISSAVDSIIALLIAGENVPRGRRQ
jgi:uncharacterized protein